MTDFSRSTVDFSTHPDAPEMRERYTRVLAGPQAIVVDGLVLLAGLYTAISPWVTRFGGDGSLVVDNLIIGLAVAMLACGPTVIPGRMYRLSWAMAAIGVWQIISPWVIGPDTTRVIWNNVVTGGVITALGIAAASMLLASAPKGHAVAH